MGLTAGWTSRTPPPPEPPPLRQSTVSRVSSRPPTASLLLNLRRRHGRPPDVLGLPYPLARASISAPVLNVRNRLFGAVAVPLPGAGMPDAKEQLLPKAGKPAGGGWRGHMGSLLFLTPG